MPLALLTATRLVRERGDHKILDDISVTVGPNDRIGVVGPNGVGKSTLLHVLAGLERPDRGRVELAPPQATVGYLAQEPDVAPDETVDAYLRRRTGVSAAERDLAAAADAVAREQRDSGERYNSALERWLAIGAADIDARIEVVLRDVGMTPSALTLRTAVLSGGQRARVSLAAILLSRFDVLLLDEPTNDLDFDGLERLEAFVIAQAGGLMIVSHDRAFLARTITSVLEIDEQTHRARLFRGGWTAYLEERATLRQHAEEAYAAFQDERRALRDRAQRERQWATTGVRREKRNPRDNDKAQRDFRVNRTEKLASRSRMTEKALARLTPVEKPWEGWQLRFTIEQAPRSGAVVARLSEAVIRRGSFVLGPLDIEIGWGERIAITGANGSGKTTLVQALLGHIPLEAGQQSLGPSVVVGELRQDRSLYPAGDLLLDAFLRYSNLSVAEGRSLLAKFGLFADHISRRIGSLSPGERTRAHLAAFQVRGVNLLVLDEPTNHLDLPAIEQLEVALAGYDGTLLLVSHDRWLLESVAVTRRIALPAPA